MPQKSCIFLVLVITAACVRAIDWSSTIEEFVKEYNSAYNSGDLTLVGQFVTDDVTLMSHKFATLRGREEFLSKYQGMPDYTMTLIDIRYTGEQDAVFAFDTKFTMDDSWRLGHGLALVTTANSADGFPLFKSIAWSTYDLVKKDEYNP